MDLVNSTAYRQIRQRILSGEYPPGVPLPSDELSKRLGVSRTPVRDALRQLEADGLVEITPRLGATVRAVTIAEFSELCTMRLALESHAAGLAARNRTEAELQLIRVPLENMRQLTERILPLEDEEPLKPELQAEDVRFHVLIMSAARCELMKKEILRLHLINRIVSIPSPADLKAVVPRSERNERRMAVMRSHEAIFEAIASRDSRGAKMAMEDHIQDIIENSLRLMARATTSQPLSEISREELEYLA